MKTITKNRIDKWLKAKEELNKWKALEIKLRKDIVEQVAPGETEAKTHSYHTKFGIIKVKINTYLKIDENVLEAITPKLSEAELNSFKWKAEVKRREFNLLDKKSLLRKAVIETPGSPTLEFKPPKKEK